MPRVPDWQAPRGGSAVLPHAALQAAAVPFVHKGIGDGLMAAGRTISRLQQHLDDEADMPLLIDADNQLSTALQRLTFDADEGYLQLKGEAALRRPQGASLEQEYLQKADKAASAILQNLPNPRQREKFEQRLVQRRGKFQSDLIRYTGQQAGQYRSDVMQGAIATATRDMALAFADAPALAENREKIAAASYALAQQQGLSGLSAQQFIQGNLSHGHAAALQAMVEGGLQGEAQSYLAQHQAEMTVEAARKAGAMLGQALRAELAGKIAADLWRDASQPPDGAPASQGALVLAQMAVESGGKLDAVSPKGALGLMQLLPDTARDMAAELGVPYDEQRLTTDAAYNLQLGSAYSEKMQQRYDGNQTLALAAYNAGPARVDEWLKGYGDPRKGDISEAAWLASIPPQETRDYVTRVQERVAKLQDKAANAPGTVAPATREALALAGVLGIADPELQKRVKSQLENYQQVADAQQNALFEEMARVVEQSGYQSLPAAQLAQLPSRQREKLWQLDDLLRKGQEPVTDYHELTRLLSLPAAQLARESPADFRLALDNSAFARVMNAWQAAQKGDTPALAALKSEQQQLAEAMHRAGITTGQSKAAQSKSNTEKQQQFQGAWQMRRDAFLQRQGRAPDFNENQALLDQLLLEVKVSGEGWLRGDKNTHLWQVPPEQLDKTYVDDGTLELADIPAFERYQIIEYLRSSALPASEARIKAEYLNRLSQSGIGLKSDPALHHRQDKPEETP